MSDVTKVIGACPCDGREWECQCARCGSSCHFADCDNCGGEGEIEDTDWQGEGEYHTCDWCRGAGGWWQCCSSPDWCETHPCPGRAEVKPGAIEWFTFDAPRTPPSVDAVDPHAADPGTRSTRANGIS